MSYDLNCAGVLETAEAVRGGIVSASAVTAAALDRIEEADDDLSCFTAVLAERARREAAEVDRKIAAGQDAGPLAGVPFAAKNLFDIEGIATLAVSKIRANAPPAWQDAAAMDAFTRAGAVLLGALNIDEFAYGFTTENTHYGPTRNPHDLTRVANHEAGRDKSHDRPRLALPSRL